MTREQLKLINKSFTIYNSLQNKHEMVRFINEHCEVEDRILNYDTAYPSPLMDQITPYYSEARNGVYVFDYTKNKFGQLVNLNDRFNSLIRKFLER